MSLKMLNPRAVNWSFYFLLLSLTILLLVAAKPYKQGFYCNDYTISKPFKTNTVSGVLIGAISCLFPPIIAYITKNIKRMTKTPIKTQLKLFLEQNYTFVIGVTITMFVTQICKVSVGRLRPNFLDACRPVFTNNTVIKCSSLQDTLTYITDYKCSRELVTEAVMNMSREVHMSFFSGHSSLAAHAAVYLCCVVQSCMGSKFKTCSMITQSLLISCALWVGSTRISDYWHHWEDVTVGLIVGALMALWCNCCAMRLQDNQQGTQPVTISKSNSSQQLNCDNQQQLVDVVSSAAD